MIVWCFLCNNIARMGLQNTTNTWEMHDAHASNQTFSSLQYCKDGLTKHNKHARCLMIAYEMPDERWSSDVFFVTLLQGWVYKTKQRGDMLVWRFLCNTIARMGLSSDVFCKNVARNRRLDGGTSDSECVSITSRPNRVLTPLKRAPFRYAVVTPNRLFRLPKSSFGFATRGDDMNSPGPI